MAHFFKKNNVLDSSEFTRSKSSPAANVTRYWGKNVAQMFTKIAQINATAVFTKRDPCQSRPKSQQYFGLLL